MSTTDPRIICRFACRALPERRRRERANLRLRHAATWHAQPHHGDRHLQGAQGQGRHERAGATHRRRQCDHSDGRARRSRDRHQQHHGSAGRFRRSAEGSADHRHRARAAHAVFCAQVLEPEHHRRPQGQARRDGLFRHAQHRQGGARHARERRSDREGRRAGAGAERDPQRRRLRLRRCRHVLLRIRRAEGARGRRHGRRHPRARAGREGHGGGPQDHAVGLSHPGRAESGVHRRREADEGLQLRQRAAHSRQGAGRHRSTSSSTRWKRTSPTWSPCSRCCASSPRRTATSNTACRITRAR